MSNARADVPRTADELTDSDRAILDVLATGRATKGYLIDETGLSRNTVYNRLEILEAAGNIREVHSPTRLFEIVDDPRQSEE
jgi:Fe2+ or Zn2+ uptake regulation protein